MFVALLACAPDPEEPRGGTEPGPDPIALIDAALGGTIASEDGVLTVTIPPGALSEDTEVSVTVVDEADWAADVAGTVPLSPVYELEPDGTTFSEPVAFAWSLAEPPADVVEADGALRLVYGSSLGADGTVGQHLSTVVGRTDAGGWVVDSEVAHFSKQWLAYEYSDLQPPYGSVSAALGGGKHAKGEEWPAAYVHLNPHSTFDGHLFWIASTTGPIEVVGPGRQDWDHPFDEGRSWMVPVLPRYACTTSGSGTVDLQVLLYLSALDIADASLVGTRFTEKVECVSREEKAEWLAEQARLAEKIAELPVPGSADQDLDAEGGEDAWTVAVPPSVSGARSATTSTVEVCVTVSGGSAYTIYYPHYPPGFDFVDTVPGCTELTNPDPDLANDALVVVSGTGTVTVTSAYVP